MSIEIKFNKQANETQLSMSTVLIAERGNCSIHWGNTSRAGETTPIMSIKADVFTFYLDPEVVGVKRLAALKNNFYQKDAKLDPKLLSITTAEDRRDAAYAAIQADDIGMAVEISPQTLFDAVWADAMAFIASRMDHTRLVQILDGALREIASTRKNAFEDGRRDAKAELCKWLGVPAGRFADP